MHPESTPVSTEDGASVTCASCEACCCRLEVILSDEPHIPFSLTEEDRWGGLVMKRLDDGWCAALDRNTMLCTIYEHRPWPCRDFETGSSECLEERQLIPHVHTLSRDLGKS